MNDMIINVDSFLNFNKFAVLKGKGNISKFEPYVRKHRLKFGTDDTRNTTKIFRILMVE